MVAKRRGAPVALQNSEARVLVYTKSRLVCVLCCMAIPTPSGMRPLWWAGATHSIVVPSCHLLGRTAMAPNSQRDRNESESALPLMSTEVPPRTGPLLGESEEIVAYLFKTYGGAA